MNSQPSWYLILTKPRREHEAREHLERQGYTTYLPMLMESKKRNGRLRDILSPLFPRYIFIQLTAGLDDWSPIRSTLGVSSLVCFGSSPARIPDILVAGIQIREAEDGYHHAEKASLHRATGFVS